ncbi:PREDICTED: F-box protein At1g61340-like [Tarenaya hassleriana]|uniref:F-box protein At1g61340-like n=1 Tax=Tarenaya hassleriana TaxID=28532 RepID=UPI00053C21AA|nr:PREDICTED: F-box protein At1g61340-like [Tarenaya hassleriana]
MALGKRKFGALKSNSDSRTRAVDDGDLGLGLGLESVRYRRRLERKRVRISGEEEVSMFGQISSKRLCHETLVSDNGTSQLESLPPDILVRVLCGVEHEDLKQLFHVSKTIREATLVAKHSHFAYTTPKKTLVFRGELNPDGPTERGDEVEAPTAPKARRYRRNLRIKDKELSTISIHLKF